MADSAGSEPHAGIEPDLIAARVSMPAVMQAVSRQLSIAQDQVQLWENEAARLRTQLQAIQVAVDVVDELTAGLPAPSDLVEFDERQVSRVDHDQCVHCGSRKDSMSLQDQILDVVRSEPGRVWSPSEVIERVPHIGRKTVDNSLRRFVDQGKLEWLGRGQYRLMGPVAGPAKSRVSADGARVRAPEGDEADTARPSARVETLDQGIDLLPDAVVVSLRDPGRLSSRTTTEQQAGRAGSRGAAVMPSS